MLKCEVFQGDITHLEMDAIVNAANSALAGGGGVDGAIHAAAGPELIAASEILGPCPAGSAVITPGFNLASRFVIHAVGPVYRDGNRGEADILRETYESALKIAENEGVETMAFPCISTGAYRFPIRAAAEIAIETVTDWQANHSLPSCVVFCCYDSENSNLYSELLNLKLKSSHDETRD